MVNGNPHTLNGKLNGTEEMPLSKVDEVLARLKTAAGASNDKQLAEFLGMDPQATTNAKRQGKIPALWLVKMASKTTYSVDWLLFGTGPMHRGGTHSDALSPEDCLSPADFTLLPLLKSRVAAGPEGEILYEEVGDYYPFKRWWVEKISGRSAERRKHLVLVKVRGDSMSPTINQGEIILVDTYEAERVQIRTGQIYLVTMPDGSSAIKRLAVSRDEGRVKLICMSDNISCYQPFEFELDPGRSIKHYVLGRVRWAGKEFD
jgi:SOS-response transcriptional repressor LexA